MPLFAESPSAKINYVGAIGINPCQDPKILADWYAKFGIETKKIEDGYNGQFDTPGGPFYFGIHPQTDPTRHCPGNLSVVFRVENFTASLASMKEKDLLPESIKDDEFGKFANFHDPDGNKISIWGD